LLRIAL